MASLRHPHKGQPVYLMSHHTLGRRQDTVDTHIAQAEVSGIHAAIKWTGAHWQIRDLSRNGTWLNGQQLEPAKNRVLELGDRLNFGRSHSSVWRVDNLDPPQNLLIDRHNGDCQLLEPYHLLPDDLNPLSSLYFNPANGVWIYELIQNAGNNDSAQVVGHNSRIDCARHSWQLFLANNQPLTAELVPQQLCIIDFNLNFNVSHHEEHVQLQLQCDDVILDVPMRTHNYLLLYLARARNRDRARGVNAADQGWVAVEVVTRELGINTNHLNTQIFRARKQIAGSSPEIINTANLVERRSWELRLGCNLFAIYKNSQLEAAATELI